MTCTDTSASACPCGTVSFPQVICNAADLPEIAYRVGDFVAFRHRLLQALPNETELSLWRPGASGDLAVQMMEWWAYLADILTFYNERIANEDYLRTALLPESVNHLVQILGYRPRPALGARGTLAAVLSPGARLPLTLPAGMQIQSKPGPGQAPQVFELGAQAIVQAPDIVSANVLPVSARLLPADGSNWVWLAGKVSGIKSGDRLLLINGAALTAQAVEDFLLVAVRGTAARTDPLGNPVTQVGFTTVAGSIAGGAQAADYVLLRSSQSAPPWGYPTASAVIATVNATTTSIDLASVARGVTPGSLVLLDVSAAAGLTPVPIIARSYAEAVWFANCGATNPGTTAPAANAIAIPHAEIGFASFDSTGAWATTWNANAKQATARWGWTQVGRLAPALQAADYLFSGGHTGLVPAPGAAAFPATGAPVLVEDPTGNAASAIATPIGTAITLAPLTTLPTAGLASPISVMFDLLQVSRGKSVPSETIGSGNPTVAGQDFTLKQSPVTYFADTASVSGDGFNSTVQVKVNGVRWQEQQSFYGQPPNAQVFVLREDDQGQTHVMFGDGVNGALLPTGSGNVVATYRYGAGALAPAAETLTSVLTPQPGLKGVKNPLQPTGGADADSAAKLRSQAPRSVLTFNRAVSLDDYAVIAQGASGVTQVATGFVFDPLSQRPVVTIWVAGDSGAVGAVKAAINGVAVPNQGLNVLVAKPITAVLRLTYILDPRFDDATARTALTTALVDPDVGLLGTYVIGIGQSIYESQIDAACLAVPGVLAIRDLSFAAPDRVQFFVPMPRVGRLRRFGAPPACTGHRFSPGAGNYFAVPNDSLHLILNPGSAS